MATDLSRLNEQQLNAVLSSVDKNVVLLAGAGAGKTATMVTRTQYLVDDLGVDPSNIMLVTFTNKAANEILERISKVCPGAYKMWIGTFHKICIRIIRTHGELLNIKNFSILDSKGQKDLIRSLLDSRGVEYNAYLVNTILTRISEFKNNMRRPSEVLMDSEVEKLYADIYQDYQNTCWRRRTFDFDDLIIYGTLLVSNFDSVKTWAHDKFKYIMADEVQDTNMAQFVFLNNIIGNNNVMLVGDVNQSIYGFRNARPQYLENFSNIHPNTFKMKLEKNYRSTQTIINAANRVVEHNSFGTKLEMFCDNEVGDKIQIYEANDSMTQAKWIASEILMQSDKDLSDFAIIYRANHQSRIIEEVLVNAGINYTVFGSTSFYSRKEVRDMLAWLKLCTNEYDIDSLKRVLGTLKGVGKTTIDNIVKYSQQNMLNTHDVISKYLNSGTASRITNVAEIGLLSVSNIANKSFSSCSEIIEVVFRDTNIHKELITLGTEDAIEKLEILDEFQNMVHSMETNDKENLPMVEIIDQISLLSDIKGEEKAEANCVKLMTAHASKGLEFDTVFIVDAQEGSFPHKNAIAECTKDAIEEERRLFYVAMTRAQKKLYITYVRAVRNADTGSIIPVQRSRFLNEIPTNLTEKAF